MKYRWGRGIPLLARGPCLEPWFLEGDVTWHDPMVTPDDCDLVAVELPFKRRGRNDGTIVRLTAIKQYRIESGRRYLCCNQGFVPMEEAELLGTVTAWRRPSWWRRPSVRHMKFCTPSMLDTDMTRCSA